MRKKISLKRKKRRALFNLYSYTAILIFLFYYFIKTSYTYALIGVFISMFAIIYYGLSYNILEAWEDIKQ
jgi:hypothetical protein|tara:strand:- start:143 stop:352 length:210 start_codon:yes stop_codon:yes gene_type:complete